ncbi:MAG: hypothetical protein N3D73_01760 [Candidatus Diapherotrites archaeon]|nr:hypothetical protein [Candidatus Diapherotrites archaeon]
MVEKRAKLIFYFSAIYFIFIAILIYLSVFNTGLSFKEKFNESTFSKDIYLFNESKKTIKNITISYILDKNKVKIADIKTLKPGEYFLIDYNFPQLKEILLVAEAPFYQSVVKHIVVGGQKTGLDYKVISPLKVFLDTPFELTFEICNFSNNMKEVIVEEQHSMSFFKEGNIKKSLNIDSNSCEKIKYILTPVAEGKTTIYFNTNVYGIIETNSFDIEVEK